MFHIQRLTSLAVILMLGGCTGSVIQDQARGLSTSATALRGTILDKERDVRLARARFLAELGTSAGDAEFVEYVCAGEDLYAAQRSALASVGSLTDAVDAAYAATPGDLGTLIERNIKRQAMVPLPTTIAAGTPVPAPLTPAQEADALRTRCRQTVESDLQKFRGRGRVFTVGAVLGVAAAAGPLIEGFKKVSILLLQYEDRRRREAELANYLQSPETTNAMVAALGPCVSRRDLPSDEAVANCVRDDPASRAAPLAPEAVGTVVLDKRLAALAVVDARWRTLISNRGGILRDRLLIAHDSLHAALADYDDMRARRVGPENHVRMVQGFRAMQRISSGDLTDAERERLWRDGIGEFVTGVVGVGTALNGLRDPLDKFGKAWEVLER